MTNQLEVKRQEHAEQIGREVLAAVEFELLGSCAHAGINLTGFSVKYSEVDCLMVLRGGEEHNKQIAFVGAPDLANCFRKAVREAYSDALNWRPDKFASE